LTNHDCRIYNLEKAHQQAATSRDAESAPLIDHENPDSVFLQALDAELKKICEFYQNKESEIYQEVDNLIEDEQNYVAEAEGLGEEVGDDNRTKQGRKASVFRNVVFTRPRRSSTISASVENIEEEPDSDDEDEVTDETSTLRSKNFARRTKSMDASQHSGFESMQSSRELGPKKRRTSLNIEDYSEQAMQALINSGITLKKRSISQYVALCELKSYVQLNKTGFAKALKKYDKILDRNLKSKYMEENVKVAYPFKSSTSDRLDEYIRKMESCYANVATQDDISAARKELRLHLREHVVWERNTVWREMIGIERKAQAANLGIRQTLLGGSGEGGRHKQGDELDIEATKEVTTPVGTYSCPSWLFSSTFFTLIAIVLVFAVLLAVPIMDSHEQQNCLAMLIFVSLLWATEVSSSKIV
jgi:phosphate transporter